MEMDELWTEMDELWTEKDFGFDDILRGALFDI